MLSLAALIVKLVNNSQYFYYIKKGAVKNIYFFASGSRSNEID
jgi:hypothetical protein